VKAFAKLLCNAPWLLEPCSASGHLGGGRDIEGSTRSQPDRDPVHQAGAKLYRAEALATEWTPAKRQRLRARYSAGVLRQIEQLMLANLHSVPPTSLLGQALHYLQGQWHKLVRFVQNGSWPLDSNPVENAIRPFVVGRKGWLFADTVGGANASANLYSLMETAKANGIEPYRYLVALFKRLPLAQTADDYEAMLPWNIALSAA